MVDEVARFTVGEFAMLTLGVPLIPTFQVPLCWADTVPETGTGSGLVTVTGMLSVVGVETAG